MRKIAILCLGFCCINLALSFGQTPGGRVSVVDLEQMTNDVILTVEDFKYDGHGLKRAHIDAAKLEDALRSDESKPEAKDPSGHWGDVTGGLRMSLRFSKSRCLKGEPIVATILVRNVTKRELEYPIVKGGNWDLHFVVSDNQNRSLGEERSGEPSGTTGAKSLVVYPRTQRRFVLRLDQRFDLTRPGIYSVTAKSKVPQPSNEGLVEISSGTARLQILGPQVSGTNLPTSTN